MEFKIGEGQRVTEIDKDSEGLSASSNEMVLEAKQKRRILDSIHVTDDEDKEVVEKTVEDYGDSYENAHNEQIETPGTEIIQEGENIKQETDAEIENVKDGIGKYEQAGNLSEIGRNVAEVGKAKLEGSGAEYEDISSDAERITKETGKQVQSTLSELKGLF